MATLTQLSKSAKWGVVASKIDGREAMKRAWLMAKGGARRFGGKPAQYFVPSLRLEYARQRALIGRQTAMLDRVTDCVNDLIVTIRAEKVRAAAEYVAGVAELRQFNLI